MQTYQNPAGRNEKVAADSSSGAVKPGSVKVPFPEKGAKPSRSGAGKVKSPPGFNGGLIPGKI